MQAHQVAEYGAAQIGADPLPQPGNQVKADHGAERHGRSHADNKHNRFPQAIGVGGGEALINENLQAVTQ